MEKPKPEIHSTQNASNEIFVEYLPMFRVYNDGRVKHMNVSAPVPPSLDRNTAVQSKDMTIFPDTGVSVRLFNPIKIFHENRKKPMPILMYCHGSGFCSGSTYSRVNHKFLNRLACEAQALVVSVEYRKATKHPLPAAYNDCFDALMWIFSHNHGDNGNSQLSQARTTKEPWLESGRVDFSRVFVVGDSSGANVAHQVVLQAGLRGLGNNLVKVLILIQPFFWGTERIGDEFFVSNGRVAMANKLWAAARWGSPASSDDPWMNPSKDPKLSWLGCRKVLICIAKEDELRDREMLYGYALKKSGWVGDVVVVESDGEDHAFQLTKPSSPNSKDLMTKIVCFVNNTPHSRI